MVTKTFELGTSIKYGWEKTKENLVFLIGVLLLMFVVNMVSGQIQASIGTDGFMGMATLVAILSSLVMMFIQMNFVRAGLGIVAGKKPSFNDLLVTQPIVKYVIGNILTSIIVGVGLVLLIVPGIFLAVRLGFTHLLIVDKNMDPIEALKKSWEITSGHTLQLFLLAVVLILLNLGGALLFFVGLLITIPVSFIAMISVYKQLSS